MKDIHRCGQKNYGLVLSLHSSLSSTIQLDHENNYSLQSGSLTVTLSPDAKTQSTSLSALKQHFSIYSVHKIHQ